MKVKWRKWNNILHRDLGYMAFGLTIIYAVSGVAVNHVHNWNPNYKIEYIESKILPSWDNDHISKETILDVLNQLGETAEYNNSFMPDEETLRIFQEGNTITVNLTTGMVIQEKIKPRKILYEMNFLHLNHPKKFWTYLADLYAVVLAILAVTGLFVLSGRKGITGRGSWLTSIGIIIPVIILWLYL